MHKLKLIINCYNYKNSSFKFPALEMIFVKKIELPFVPFFGLEITQDGTFICELEENTENSTINSFSYDTFHKEFSYYLPIEKFNVLGEALNEDNGERIFQDLTRKGFKLVMDKRTKLTLVQG